MVIDLDSLPEPQLDELTIVIFVKSEDWMRPTLDELMKLKIKSPQISIVNEDSRNTTVNIALSKGLNVVMNVEIRK